MLKRVLGNAPGSGQNYDMGDTSCLASEGDMRGNSCSVREDYMGGVSCSVSEASFPAPFPRTLEYNPPVHGTWNIVHIGMTVPESHSIYVCSDNCMRGVVMTAAEMGCRDRFHCVTITEQDVQIDNLETITIEGVSDVLEHLENKPPVVFVFLVCLHIFTGSDEDYIFKKLSERWPQVHFVKAYMDCVRQKEGPSPDMKLRLAEFEPIMPLETDPRRVNILGCDVPYADDSELITILSSAGCRVRQLQDCKTYQEFLNLGNAAVNICTYVNGQNGVRLLSERLNSRYLYLSPAVSYKEIREQIHSLADVCRIASPSDDWFVDQKMMCERSLDHLSMVLAGRSVVIDFTAHPRSLGIARLLLEHDIDVKCVYVDSILEEDREAFNYLRNHYPEFKLVSTILPGMVHFGRGDEDQEQIIAIGQKAAWYAQTDHFANMIEGGGLWGFQGIRQLCALIEEAAGRKTDRKEIVPRKGMGWPSLCSLTTT